MGFMKAYIKSMRPYTFFITGIAGLIGMLLVESSASILQKSIVLLLLFSCYGVNQVINDLLGLKEDKWNAPKRPSVSGELNKEKALILTLILFLTGAIVTFFFNPYALLIYFSGYLFNFLYEYMKGIPVIGTFWFGIMIALAPFYGALAITNLNILQVLNNVNLLYSSLLVILSASTMCYFTYFKDYLGDKKENKNTVVVLLSLKDAKYLNFFMSIIPFIILFLLFCFNLWTLQINLLFLIIILLDFVLMQSTSFRYFAFSNEDKKSLELNFESSVLFLSSIIVLIRPLLGIILSIFSFIIIKLIFISMYKKELY